MPSHFIRFRDLTTNFPSPFTFLILKHCLHSNQIILFPQFMLNIYACTCTCTVQYFLQIPKLTITHSFSPNLNFPPIISQTYRLSQPFKSRMFFALSLIMSTMRVKEQSEEQEKEHIELKAKGQVLETELVEEKKIHEKNTASLEEKYQNEIVSEAENEIMVPIHQMKVQLPLENWHDLLAFVPRRQLGNAVSEIGDYQFASIIQSFLHGFGKIKLGLMNTLSPDFSEDETAVLVSENTGTITNMPDWPMPQNVKDFKGIVLNYVDASILDFLGKFQQNSLLTDVNMKINSASGLNRPDFLPLLIKIAPFITSIDSIEFRGVDLIEMAYNINNTNHGNSHESQLLLKKMMAQTRILVTPWNDYGSDGLWEDKMDWFCSWLYTPRDDGKPRMLRSHVSSCYGPTDRAVFIERIKKDFNEAKNAVSFFVYIITYRQEFENISIDNDKTNEKLVIKTDGDFQVLLTISRYPREAANDWIEANENEITKSNRDIRQWNRETLDRNVILPYEVEIADSFL